MSYVDGFVVAIPKKNLAAYKKMARLAAKVWMEYGALDYREFIEDDVQPGKTTSFPQSVKLERGEVVGFAYVVFKSRAHRDRVNKKVLSDPRMKIDPSTMPFDGARMIYGGFKSIVEGRPPRAR